nr:MAG TPA: hypothetical protein [Caudoviricetes sp.]
MMEQLLKAILAIACAFVGLYLILILTNPLRMHDSNKGMYRPQSVKTILFDRNEVLFVYVYSLRNEKLLAYGCMGWEDQSSKDYEFSIYAYPGLEKLSFDEAVAKSRNNENVEIYMNVDKNIKIVIIPEPKN